MRYLLLFTLLISFTVNAQVKPQKIVIDSITFNRLDKIGFQDQYYRTILAEEKQNLNQKQSDSLWKLQYIFDKENIINLIKIVKEYGYLDSSNSNTNVAVYAVFMHTIEDYKEQVKKIIDEEKKKGNIDDTSYSLINWHIAGRKALPFKINYTNKADGSDNK